MDVTQKIVNQVQLKCTKKGIVDLSPSLIHFIVQSIIVSKYGGTTQGAQYALRPQPSPSPSHASPNYDDTYGKRVNLLLLDDLNAAILTPSQILSVIDEACELLCQQDNPRLATVKMQNAVLSLIQAIRLKHNEITKSHLYKSEKLVEEIIKKKEEAEVFGDIVLFILHETRLLNNSTEKIEKETMTALESVIPRNFVHSFITQEQDEKKNQLYDLWKIVWGIRLFNKASNKGGSGIERLTMHDPERIIPLQKKIEREIEELLPEIREYEVTLEVYNKNTRLRQEFTNRRQYLAFLQKLLKQVNHLKQYSDDVEKAMIDIIDEINQIVTQKTSVPKSTIYPLFIDLADSWLSTEEYKNQFMQLEDVFQELNRHRYAFQSTIHDVSHDQTQDEGDYDAQLHSAKSNSAFEAQRVTPNEAVKPELAGFDPTTLASTSEIPKEGSMKVDYVNYMDKYYSFQSEESVTKFMENPQHYLEMAMNTIAKENELIYLLNLENKLPKSVILSGDKQKRKQLVSVGMQTEVHPVDGYIDPKYEWSEWKLRSLALKVARLRTKRTHSTQTVSSHYRRDNMMQVDSKEDQPIGSRTREQQTRKETGTNPVQHFTYIKGLRSVGNKAQLVKIEFDPMDAKQMESLKQ